MSASAPQSTPPGRGGAPTPFTHAGTLGRWSARLIGLLLTAMVVAMWVYDRDGAGTWLESPVVRVGIAVVFAGFVVGWRRDMLAGVLILAGVAVMVAGTWGAGGPLGAFFALFVAAGLLHLMAGLARRLEQAGHGR